MAIQRAHLILFVADQPAATRFYRAVLDQPPRLAVPGMTEFALESGLILGLMPAAGIRRLLHGAVDPGRAAGIPRAEVYLVVSDPAAWHARALAAGAVELSPLAPRDWGHTVAYSQDLDGHLLAFARAPD